MIKEPSLRELLKTCVNPNVGCSIVFKAVVSTINRVKPVKVTPSKGS